MSLPACHHYASSIQRWAGYCLLIALGLLTSDPALAMYTTFACNNHVVIDVSRAFPLAAISIPHTAATEDLIGPWYNIDEVSVAGGSNPYDFAMCTRPILAKNGGSDGVDKNLYVVMEKPLETILVPGNLTVTDDGMTFRVFTTPQLQALGLGYIVRVRATNTWGDTGQWLTPQTDNDWGVQSSPDASGIPFWRAYIRRSYGGDAIATDVQSVSTTTTRFMSLQDWYDYINPINDGLVRNVFYYSAQVQVRYVVLAPTLEFDPRSGSTTILHVYVKPRPGTFRMVRHRVRQVVTVTSAPWGTCTTGDVVVPLGAVWVSALPNVGSTAPPRDFDITLTQCPKVNIGYSFVPPTGVGYNNSAGVLNLDSTATAQGVGIQLRHRNAPNYGNNLIQYNPTAPTTPTYTRTASQGVNNPTGGVDHTIPMRAAIYRTGTVQPGTVRASVIVHIVYP